MSAAAGADDRKLLELSFRDGQSGKLVHLQNVLILLWREQVVNDMEVNLHALFAWNVLKTVRE